MLEHTFSIFRLAKSSIVTPVTLAQFGGGFRMGQAIGATNRNGEYPVENPLTPQDLLATVYHHLGIDHKQAFLDYFGRPVHILPSGEVIKELL